LDRLYRFVTHFGVAKARERWAVLHTWLRDSHQTLLLEDGNELSLDQEMKTTVSDMLSDNDAAAAAKGGGGAGTAPAATKRKLDHKSNPSPSSGVKGSISHPPLVINADDEKTHQEEENEQKKVRFRRPTARRESVLALYFNDSASAEGQDSIKTWEDNPDDTDDEM